MGEEFVHLLEEWTETELERKIENEMLPGADGDRYHLYPVFDL